jgi:hypothetical protein
MVTVIPAASLAALTESSVQRIGGMIIPAYGFCSFLPKQKYTADRARPQVSLERRDPGSGSGDDMQLIFDP